MADANPITEKRCGCCKATLPVTNFHRCSREKSGYQQWCKACRKGHKRDERLQYFRDSYHNGKDKYLEYFYKRNYGITLAEYRAMEAEQGAKCYLCRNVCPSGRRLAVDHDHKTGKARRLLCMQCNKAIGSFREDTDVMRKAIQYLESFEQAQCPTLSSPSSDSLTSGSV